MVLDRVREAWKRRAIRNLIKNAGIEDWCIFVKALCNSAKSCHGFPYTCKSCFDNYFEPAEILQHILEK